MKIVNLAEAYRAASVGQVRGEANPSVSLPHSPAFAVASSVAKTDRVSVSESFLALQAASARTRATADRIAELKRQFESNTLLTSPEATAAKLLADEQDSVTDRAPARG